MKRSGGLGKGLDALIPPAKEKHTGKDTPGGHVMVDIHRIEPNRAQPRKTFDEDALDELADSIRQVGVLEPLLVREIDGQYDLVAGERRWRAARKAGLKEVPVTIRNDLTDQQVVEIQLIENIQREDLNAIEEAQAFERLIKEFHMKQDDVAERVSKSRVAITNSMRLLKLSPGVQQMVIDKRIKETAARALIPVEDTETQFLLAQRIMDEDLSVREVEKIVRSLDTPGKIKREKKKNEALEAIYKELGERCQRSLGTKVSITGKGTQGAGKIEIEFYSADDLEKITDRLIEEGV
ncbi:MAG: ParB/RepB/Spo0J family partition protein [Lachnospiraceae bacterium]|nr:ParB/RepB/Spo0J family partition protein [Lachnospiraceae bacterium]